MIDAENMVACIETLTVPWPTGTSMSCELVYHLTPDGKVHNKHLTPEQHTALQALVDYRKPLEHLGRGSSLEAMSAEEEALFDALSETILTPAQRRARQALLLVKEVHRPVALVPDFGFGHLEVLDDGTGLIEIMESGPNWSNRYTLYILTLDPVVSIIQAYTPFGEHCINYHFQRVEKSPDDSHQFDDFPGQIAQLWAEIEEA